MSSFSTSRTRTLHTLLSGSPTMSRLLSVTFHPEVSRWLPPSLVTPLPSRSSLREFLSSSLLCSEERYVLTGCPRNLFHYIRLCHHIVSKNSCSFFAKMNGTFLGHTVLTFLLFIGLLLILDKTIFFVPCSTKNFPMLQNFPQHGNIFVGGANCSNIVFTLYL